MASIARLWNYFSTIDNSLNLLFDGIGSTGQLVELGQNWQYHGESMEWTKRNMQLDSQSIRLDALDHAKEEIKSHYDTYVTQIDTQLVVLALIFPFALNVIQFSDPFVPSDCSGCIESKYTILTLLWSCLIGVLLILPFWGILMLVNCKLYLDSWLQKSLIRVQQKRAELIRPDSNAKTCVNPNCRHKNSNAARFCEMCGAELPREWQTNEIEGTRALSALASDDNPNNAPDDTKQEKWKTISGYMTGKVLHKEKMTIPEAKAKCKSTRNCTGFYYQGPQDQPTNEAIDMTFCGSYDTREGGSWMRPGSVCTSWMLEERIKQENLLEDLLDHRESIRRITDIVASVVDLQGRLSEKWNGHYAVLVQVSSYLLCASAAAAMLLAALSVWLFLYNKGGMHRYSSNWFAFIIIVGVAVPVFCLYWFECGNEEDLGPKEQTASRQETSFDSNRQASSPRKAGLLARIFSRVRCGKRRPMPANTEPFINARDRPSVSFRPRLES